MNIIIANLSLDTDILKQTLSSVVCGTQNKLTSVKKSSNEKKKSTICGSLNETSVTCSVTVGLVAEICTAVGLCPA